MAAMAVVAAPFGIASLIYADSRPALSLAAGGVALAAALIGHVVVFWKMEYDYRRP